MLTTSNLTTKKSKYKQTLQLYHLLTICTAGFAYRIDMCSSSGVVINSPRDGVFTCSDIQHTTIVWLLTLPGKEATTLGLCSSTSCTVYKPDLTLSRPSLGTSILNVTGNYRAWFPGKLECGGLKDGNITDPAICNVTIPALVIQKGGSYECFYDDVTWILPLRLTFRIDRRKYPVLCRTTDGLPRIQGSSDYSTFNTQCTVARDIREIGACSFTSGMDGCGCTGSDVNGEYVIEYNANLKVKYRWWAATIDCQNGLGEQMLDFSGYCYTKNTIKQIWTDHSYKCSPAVWKSGQQLSVRLTISRSTVSFHCLPGCSSWAEFRSSSVSSDAGYEVRCAVSSQDLSCSFTAGTLGCGCSGGTTKTLTFEYNFIAGYNYSRWWTVTAGCLHPNHSSQSSLLFSSNCTFLDSGSDTSNDSSNSNRSEVTVLAMAECRPKFWTYGDNVTMEIFIAANNVPAICPSDESIQIRFFFNISGIKDLACDIVETSPRSHPSYYTRSQMSGTSCSADNGTDFWVYKHTFVASEGTPADWAALVSCRHNSGRPPYGTFRYLFVCYFYHPEAPTAAQSPQGQVNQATVITSSASVLGTVACLLLLLLHLLLRMQAFSFR